LVIGFTTYLFAMLGMLFGKKIGQKVGNKVELLGGIILIGVGLKILLEHLQH
jgi:putative Mn2+ efflux pump MntP